MRVRAPAGKVELDVGKNSTNTPTSEKKTWKPKIDNTLLEAIYRFNGFTGPDEFRIVLAVYRLTEGWQQEASQIPMRRLAWELGIPVSNVYRSWKALIRKGVLLPTGSTDGLRINQDFSTWRLDPHKEHTSDKVWRGDPPGKLPGRAFDRRHGFPFKPYVCADPEPFAWTIEIIMRDKKIITGDNANKVKRGRKKGSKTTEEIITRDNAALSPVIKDIITRDNGNGYNSESGQGLGEAESNPKKAIPESKYLLRKCEPDTKIEVQEKSLPGASDVRRTDDSNSGIPVGSNDEGVGDQSNDGCRHERGKEGQSHSDYRSDKTDRQGSGAPASRSQGSEGSAGRPTLDPALKEQCGNILYFACRKQEEEHFGNAYLQEFSASPNEDARALLECDGGEIDQIDSDKVHQMLRDWWDRMPSDQRDLWNRRLEEKRRVEEEERRRWREENTPVDYEDGEPVADFVVRLGSKKVIGNHRALYQAVAAEILGWRRDHLLDLIRKHGAISAGRISLAIYGTRGLQEAIRNAMSILQNDGVISKTGRVGTGANVWAVNEQVATIQ